MAKKNCNLLLLISLPVMVAIEFVVAARFVSPSKVRRVTDEIEQSAEVNKSKVIASMPDRNASTIEDFAIQSSPSFPVATDFAQLMPQELEDFSQKEVANPYDSSLKSSENTLREGKPKSDVKWPAFQPSFPPPKATAESAYSISESMPNELRLNQDAAEPQLKSTATVQPLAAIETRELLKRWCDTQGPEVFPLEKELARRGFNRVSKEFSQRYLTGDVQQRLRLVEDAAKLPGIDSRPWLLLLAEDENADVRLTSVSVLATSRDPELIEKAWQVVIRDRDPRIAGLANRLRDLRNGTVRR